MHETLRNVATRLRAALADVAVELEHLPAHPGVATGPHGETVAQSRAAWSLVVQALACVNTMIDLETPKPEAV